jgi:hypothetical protein
MSNSEKPEDLGLFSGKLGDESEPMVDQPLADDLALLQAKLRQLTEERDALKKQLDELVSADPARKRRAIRRLQTSRPAEFEEMIDLFYQWREYSPSVQITEIFRSVAAARHSNINDREAIIVLHDKIRETRMSRLNGAIVRLGLDEAEKLLLSPGPPPTRLHLGSPCRLCGATWTVEEGCPGADQDIF